MHHLLSSLLLVVLKKKVYFHWFFFLLECWSTVRHLCTALMNVTQVLGMSLQTAAANFPASIAKPGNCHNVAVSVFHCASKWDSWKGRGERFFPCSLFYFFLFNSLHLICTFCRVTPGILNFPCTLFVAKKGEAFQAAKKREKWRNNKKRR